MNKELRDKIVKILMENITFGEKNKKVYISKIVPKLEKLFQAKEEEVVERVEIELEKYSCGKHKKLFKLLASLK